MSKSISIYIGLMILILYVLFITVSQQKNVDINGMYSNDIPLKEVYADDTITAHKDGKVQKIVASWAMIAFYEGQRGKCKDPNKLKDYTPIEKAFYQEGCDNKNGKFEEYIDNLKIKTSKMSKKAVSYLWPK